MRSHAKAKILTDRGALLLKFFRQNITLQDSERIKKRICVSLDGISSVKIAEKVRLFSYRYNCVSSPHGPLISQNCIFPQNIRLFSLSLDHIYLYYMSSE